MKNFFEILLHIILGLLIIICMIIGFLITLPFLAIIFFNIAPLFNIYATKRAKIVNYS